MTFSEHRKPRTGNRLSCPDCGRWLDLEAHADLVCDGRVWCCSCRQYAPELTVNRSFPELQDWAGAISTAFGQDPVLLLENPEARSNWRLYWHQDTCLLAEAYHEHRSILLYPPGQRLTTLCHEMAHLFTRQDHTPTWAETFARLITWVKENLE
jgi:hypothetical protein